MSDNVIPFSGRRAPAEQQVIPVKLIPAAADALERRVKAEGISEVDAVNRAVQAYDTLSQKLGALSRGDELVLKMETLPGKSFTIVRHK